MGQCFSLHSHWGREAIMITALLLRVAQDADGAARAPASWAAPQLDEMVSVASTRLTFSVTEGTKTTVTTSLFMDIAPPDISFGSSSTGWWKNAPTYAPGL